MKTRILIPRIVIPVVLLLGLAGWLFSDDGHAPDLVSVIKNIQQTLQQLDQQVKDLHVSVKALSQSGKKSKDRQPGSGTEVPDGSTANDWQLARDSYERGRRAEDLKAYDAAVEAFTKTIKLDANNDAAFLHRGYCYQNQREYDKANADFTQSLSLQPNNSRAYSARAAVLGSMGDAGKAVLDANEALRRDAKNADHYLLRGGLYAQLGRTEEAIQDYTRAIELAPKSDQGYLARAAVLRGQGQVQKSLTDCYQAIQVSPDHAAAYLCRAQFYLMTGAAQPALEDINHAMMLGQKSSETEPLLASAHTMLGGIPARDANPPKTNASVQQPQRSLAFSEKHDANFYFREARTHSLEENFQEAVKSFDEGIRLDPKNAIARNGRGYSLLRLRRFDEAIADFKKLCA